MDGHFRFNFESFGKNRERLGKLVTESTVTGHDILDIRTEKMIDKLAYNHISKVMKRPFIFRKIRGRKPVSHHHIHLTV